MGKSPVDPEEVEIVTTPPLEPPDFRVLLLVPFVSLLVLLDVPRAGLA